MVHIAHKIRAEVPDEALVLRTGGDEFLVLLRDVPASELRKVAERLLERIPATVHCGGRAVTISIGLSESRPLSELDEALVSADRYLLDAKRTGRNRIGERLISLGNPA
jgi:diguanylate cyclase (GGDEF)-like protein